MIAEKIGDLLVGQAVSTTRLRQALEQDAPVALALCANPIMRCSRKSLEQAVVDHLAASLDVGIADKILRSWAPANMPFKPSPGTLDLELPIRSMIARRTGGVTVLGVLVYALLRLTQQDARCAFADTGCGIFVGENRVWHAALTISIGDLPPAIPATSLRPFFDRRCDVYLPAQPWSIPLHGVVQ